MSACKSHGPKIRNDLGEELAVLQLTRILELYRIFDAKKWQREGTDHALTFEKFGKIVGLLSDAECDMLFSLTRKFHKIYWADYPAHCQIALKNIDSALINGADDVHLVPILDPKYGSHGFSKSSLSMLYGLLSERLPADVRFKGRKLLPAASIADHVGLKNLKRKSLTIFFDDFIGTGITFDGFHKAFKAAVPDGPNDRYACLCIAAQASGIHAIMKDTGIPVFTSITIERGITDDPALKANNAVAMMDQLERRLKIPPNYRFGYERSEALISLIRTPDNTFPLFWLDGELDGAPWTAPFPR